MAFTGLFELKILTRRGMIFDDQVTIVTLPGAEGYFGVLRDHAPLVALLGKGELTAETPRGVKTFAIRGGFAEVFKNVVTVLPDAVEGY